jgi:hypothetical protein
VEIVLSEAGPHIKASCNDCKSYIKFMSQTELKGDQAMMEIYYAIPSSKYKEGVFLTEYKNQMQLIAAKKGNDGNNYKSYAFPQVWNKEKKEAEPGEKAIPVCVNFGDRSTAISILEKILAELRGSHIKETETEFDIPF